MNFSKLLCTLFLAGGMMFFVSCEKENCGSCDKVTYENGSETGREDAGEYCGENLDEKENEEEEVGTKRITYECES